VSARRTELRGSALNINFMTYISEHEKFKKLQKRFKFDLKWESQKKLRYYMSISPRKKLEWLYQVQKFLVGVSPKKQKVYLRKLEVNR
jgi:hypothetical protein